MPIDTVNDLPPRVQYVAAAAQEDFDYPFPIFEDGDLVVDVDGETQALDTDYTVSGEGEDTGGTVSFVTPMAGGEIVTLYRDIAIARDTDFQQNGPFRAAAINDELDKAFLIMQQLESRIGRSLRLPITAEATDAETELAPLSNWLDRFIYINAQGVPEPGVIADTTMTQSIVGQLLNPLTQAESDAGVTPTNYQFPELYLARYGGSVSASAGANNLAMTRALAVVAEKGGGQIIAHEVGTYQFSSTITFATDGTHLVGMGRRNTVFEYTGSGSFLVVPNVGRCRVQGLRLKGTGLTGTGLTIGAVAGNCTVSLFRDLLVDGFATGHRMGGGTWITYHECEFGNPAGTPDVYTNAVGIDFNYFGSSNYSSGIIHYGTIVSNNADNGVKATNVAVTMNQVLWLGVCNIQNNCHRTTANPQFHMGAVSGFRIDNPYFEYIGSGTKPDAMNTDGMTLGSINAPYIDGATNAIKDRSGNAMNQVDIINPFLFNIVTAAISCASEVDVVVRGGYIASGSVTLTGTGCSYLPTGSGLASWPKDSVDFTPVLAPATSGSITQAVAYAKYSRFGSVVHFTFRINWSALSSPVGALQITGLPVAAGASSGMAGLGYVGFHTGITLSAGSLSGYIAPSATTMQLYNLQTTTAGLDSAALASSGAIVVSGSYHV